MKEYLDDAREELKRVDHMIFVSLKYTRTVDVLMNIIKRMIDAYDFAIEALIMYADEENMFEGDIPKTPLEKAQVIVTAFHDDIIKENIDLYLLFKKIVKVTEIERLREYRRHVTLKTKIDKEDVEVNIDNITEYYTIIKEFVKYINDLIFDIEE